jgi:hypothetical protein
VAQAELLRPAALFCGRGQALLPKLSRDRQDSWRVDGNGPAPAAWSVSTSTSRVAMPSLSVVGSGEVGRDGLDAQEQLLRDCAVRRSGGGQIADLALARRERTDALGLRTPRPQPG